jgi:cytochrome P450
MMNLVFTSFSGGPRSCLGKSLALLESKVATIKFLQRYDNLNEEQEREFMTTVSMRIKKSMANFTRIA